MEGWYKIGQFWEQNQFNRPQMVQFECPWPWVTNPLVSFTLEEFPFPIFCPCSSLPSFLTLQYKEMVYYGRLGKKVDFFWNKISLTGWKWSSLKAPGSYNPWWHSLLGMRVQFQMQRPFSPRPSSLSFSLPLLLHAVTQWASAGQAEAGDGVRHFEFPALSWHSCKKHVLINFLYFTVKVLCLNEKFDLIP